MYRLYDYLPSGNGYKVRLVLKQLALPYELIELDIQQRRDAHRRNSSRRIPTAAFRCWKCRARATCRRVTRSSAFLAEGSRADSRRSRSSARACGSGCASSSTTSSRTSPRCASGSSSLARRARSSARSWSRRRRTATRRSTCSKKALRDREYLVGERYSLADIALYAYTHVAHEGGFDLAPYPNDPRLVRSRRARSRAGRRLREPKALQRFNGSSTVEPVVRRASRSTCARAASCSGYVWPICTLITDRATRSNNLLAARVQRGSRRRCSETASGASGTASRACSAPAARSAAPVPKHCRTSPSGRAAAGNRASP